MKKTLIFATCLSVVLAGCNTNTGNGAYIGGNFGAILGSAIGGISDGPRGSDIGTIIGMAGGAVVGAAIGSAADRAEAREVHNHYKAVQERKAREARSADCSTTERVISNNAIVDENNGGDDILYDFNLGVPDSVAEASGNNADAPSIHFQAEGFHINKPRLDIVSAFFEGEYDKGVLTRYDDGKIVVEIMNPTSMDIEDVSIDVTEDSGNPGISISPGLTIKAIGPGRGVRFTAVVHAGRKLKRGIATFRVSAKSNGIELCEPRLLRVKTEK